MLSGLLALLAVAPDLALGPPFLLEGLLSRLLFLEEALADGFLLSRRGCEGEKKDVGGRRWSNQYINRQERHA